MHGVQQRLHIEERNILKNKNYKVQNGCHNCLHRFEKSEWDDGQELFCTFNAPKRPICGSVLMKEPFSLARREKENYLSKAKYKICSDKDPFVKAMKAWDKWTKGRRVEPAGICDHYETEKKQETL